MTWLSSYVGNTIDEYYGQILSFWLNIIIKFKPGKGDGPGTRYRDCKLREARKVRIRKSMLHDNADNL